MELQLTLDAYPANRRAAVSTHVSDCDPNYGVLGGREASAKPTYRAYMMFQGETRREWVGRFAFDSESERKVACPTAIIVNLKPSALVEFHWHTARARHERPAMRCTIHRMG